MSLDYGYGDAEERADAERADDSAELGRALLEAGAVRFCPSCVVEVLTRRDKSCLWCDHPTTLARSSGGIETTDIRSSPGLATNSRASRSSLDVGAGTHEDLEGEAA